jgi:hypothetical protein
MASRTLAIRRGDLERLAGKRLLMANLASLAATCGLVLLGGLTALLLWRLVSGGIPCGGLLEGDVRTASGTITEFSPSRTQMLVISTYTLIYGVAQMVAHPELGIHMPRALVAVQVGSHAVYLVGKAYSLLVGRIDWKGRSQ